MSFVIAPISIISAGGITLMILRYLFGRKTLICNCNSPKDLRVVITGATSGIGKATAFELAKRDWHLILGCRDNKVGEDLKRHIYKETGNNNVDVYKLDLDSFSSIRAFAEKISSNSKLHCLINNAGIMSSEPRIDQSLDSIDQDMRVNFLGPFLLTHLLEPIFKSTKREEKIIPRIINVSSALSKRGKLKSNNNILSVSTETWTPMQSYANSKQALCLFSRELYRRWGPDASEHIASTYCIFTGGMINTRLDREVGYFSNYFVRNLISRLKSVFLKSPVEGCQSILHCAISSDVNCHTLKTDFISNNESGGLYVNCVQIEWPESAKMEDLAKDVWNEAKLRTKII